MAPGTVHGNHVLPTTLVMGPNDGPFRQRLCRHYDPGKSRNELTKLRMEGGHIDEYIAKFERYVTMADTE